LFLKKLATETAPKMLNAPPNKLVAASIGQGPELLVFHGGPGFDHQYLVPHLKFLADRHTVTFFDQVPEGGLEGKRGVAFADLCAVASAVVRSRAVNSCARVFAHSFGSLVLLECLRQWPELQIDGLLVSPVPTTRASFDLMRNCLFSRMPPETLVAITAAPLTRWPAAQVKVMLPYYVSPGSNPDLDALSFDFGVYTSVYDSLDCFDYRAETARLNKCHIIRGKDDFIDREMICDVIAKCASDLVLPSAGHFPFAEQPDPFRKAAIRCLAECP
jgi:pimeloyl-ACP methyl ester carboxylesterase